MVKRNKITRAAREKHAAGPSCRNVVTMQLQSGFLKVGGGGGAKWVKIL